MNKELKPCPFCGGKMIFHKHTYTNKYGEEITNQYYMHEDEECILNEIMMPFVIGAGDATDEYIGSLAQQWNKRADED